MSWQAPYDGATPITSYQVLIQKSDGTTYEAETSNCDGTTDPQIVTDSSCEIPISALRAAPFFLDWGASVYAKIIAGNIVGYSPDSQVGNGAVILTVPDQPINVANDATITNG